MSTTSSRSNELFVPFLSCKKKVQLQYAIRRKCMFDITNLAQHHMNLFLLISINK
jgi:hypothetical protein